MSTVLANPSRPIEVLHDGQWVSGWLEASRPDDESWLGMVRYSTTPGAQYLQWRSEAEVRRKQPQRH
jgi:hypothetical protein